MIFKIAITGGVASGKSTVTAFLSALLNCESYSADKIVSELYNSQNFCIKHLSQFSDYIFNENKIVDKTKLKKWIIFNPENLNKISKIMWIECEKKIVELIEGCKRDFILFEVPLLFESKMQNIFDFLLNVESDKKMREKRAKNLSGIEKEFFEIFVANQVSNNFRRQNSDYTIENNKGLDELKAKTLILSYKIREI